MRVVQVGREPSSGKGCKDLEDHREDLIFPRVRFATDPDNNRLFDVSAKIEKQLLNAILLAGLSLVVSGPVLFVGDLFRERDTLRFGHSAIGADFPLHHELNRVNVLALVAPFNVVGAGTSLLDRIDAVNVRPGLRRNELLAVNFVELAKGRDYESAFFSGVHFRFPT